MSKSMLGVYLRVPCVNHEIADLMWSASNAGEYVRCLSCQRSATCMYRASDQVSEELIE